MRICGIKLTHDGSVALIEDGQLIFSVEMEKLNSNARYTSIEDTKTVVEILELFNYSVNDIDVFAIDGWGGTNVDALAVQPRLEIGEGHNYLSVEWDGNSHQIGVAPYRELQLDASILQEWTFDGLKLGDKTVTYNSYLHAAGHLMSTYASSPFSRHTESAYVLIWDGGMFPRLYFVNLAEGVIENLGPIFLLIGNIYTIFSQHFGPFKVRERFAKDDLSIAGKVMAYIAKGTLREELLPIFDSIYRYAYDQPMGFANKFANEFKKKIADRGFSDQDILLSFHVFIERLLITKLSKKVKRHGTKSRNLAIAGGCGLNIKWNSAIRNSLQFDHVYVSPFPNDSGSALGAACCAMYLHDKKTSLDWSVYSGPCLTEPEVPEGWIQKEYSIVELAELIYTTDEPVVFLNGRAELGPRALGNRSIIGSPCNHKMKDILNEIKQRESYRPVSPICKEEKAEDIFSPGCADPFMLFDHKVNDDWRDKIPAVIHIDNTARLQTVNIKENRVIYELLTAFEELSGIPLLCNTSANYKGAGFFPDISSAIAWGKVNYVYSEGILYEKEEKLTFDYEQKKAFSYDV